MTKYFLEKNTESLNDSLQKRRHFTFHVVHLKEKEKNGDEKYWYVKKTRIYIGEWSVNNIDQRLKEVLGMGYEEITEEKFKKTIDEFTISLTSQ